MGELRPRQKKRNNWAESEDNDDLAPNKLHHFTPGRIRASRMGQSNPPDYPGKNGSANGDFMNSTSGKPNQRKRPKNPHIESLDDDKDSLRSAENPNDYN